MKYYTFLLLHDLGLTEKLFFWFADMVVRDDRVIPARQKAVRFEIDKRLLRVGNVVANFIIFSIQIGSTP